MRVARGGGSLEKEGWRVGAFRLSDGVHKYIVARLVGPCVVVLTEDAMLTHPVTGVRTKL